MSGDSDGMEMKIESNSAPYQNTRTRRALLWRGLGMAAGATAISGTKAAHGQAICFPTASELFFEYDAATSQALTAIVQEIKDFTTKLDGLAEQIASAPDFTGELKGDAELAALLHDLELESLKTERRAYARWIKGIELQINALRAQETPKKKPDAPSEQLTLDGKTALLKLSAAEVARELEQLKKKTKK
jgi:hypothetical protein